MSCEINEIFLERKLQEGLDLGMTEEEACDYAFQALEEQG